MSKHTPGPWQRRHLDFLHICDADENGRGCAPIARVAGGKNGETRAEARANACLISAAPENYECNIELAKIVRELCSIYNHPLPNASLERSDYAIAKSTGEQE